MKSTTCVLMAVALLSFGASSAFAATLASATYDTDTYMFIGTNAQFDAGISIGTDYSGGLNGTLPSGDLTHHFNFGVIKFDNLAGIQTVANGGPSKFLVLNVHNFTGPSQIAFSVAKKDIESNTDGYPSFFFSGNPSVGATGATRQQWYADNIKGNETTLGGYAGGATHVGVIDVTNDVQSFSLDVTAAVDAWIDGSVPNFGFGVWGVDAPGAIGGTFDFASMNNPLGNGPILSSVSIPEPTSLALVAVSLCGFVLRSKRS